MTWMNVKVIMPSEISQRERQILYDLSYMWNIKQNKAKKTHHRKRNKTCGCQRQSVGEGKLEEGGQKVQISN